VPFVMGSTGLATDQSPANSQGLVRHRCRGVGRCPPQWANASPPTPTELRRRRVPPALGSPDGANADQLPSIRGHRQLQQPGRRSPEGDVSARAAARRARVSPSSTYARVVPSRGPAPGLALGPLLRQPDLRLGEFSTDLCHHATIATR
jgi:hypothetical protein